MKLEIVDKAETVLATFDSCAGRATNWNGSVPENTTCRFRMHRLPTERMQIDLTLAGESLEAIAVRQDPDAAKRETFEWRKCGLGDDVFEMPSGRHFEDKSGPIRIGVRGTRFGTRRSECLGDSTVNVVPVKFGNAQYRAEALHKLEGSPFPSLLKAGGMQPPNSHIFEKWAFECTRLALQTAGGLELTPVVREWVNAVEGSPWTTGPVLQSDLGSGKRLRLRHEPLVRKIGAENRLDELYTLRSDSLRPDISIELLEKEHGAWVLKAGICGDCKYCEESEQTRMHRWADVDLYTHIVNAQRQALLQLWLIPSGTSYGLKDGPVDGSVFGTRHTEDHIFSAHGVSRRQLVVQPVADCEKFFEEFATSALEALLGRKAS
jgi:hypothetical protein